MSKWEQTDNGTTVGTEGSEGGIILKDEEHSEGARITLEEGGSTAPFAITMGIYGAMMHTHFSANQEQAEEAYSWFKQKIDVIFKEDIEKQQELIEELVDHSSINPKQ